MDLLSILDLLNRGGVMAVLLVILVAGYKRMWVFGTELKDKQAEITRILLERDRLLDLALSATSQAGKAVEHLEKQEDRSI